jgi:hypothetical protein
MFSKYFEQNNLESALFGSIYFDLNNNLNKTGIWIKITIIYI